MPNVFPVTQLLHSLAECGIGLELGQVGFKVRLGVWTLLGADVDPALQPPALSEGDDAVDFGYAQAMLNVKLQVTIMCDIVFLVLQIRNKFLMGAQLGLSMDCAKGLIMSDEMMRCSGARG